MSAEDRAKAEIVKEQLIVLETMKQIEDAPNPPTLSDMGIKDETDVIKLLENVHKYYSVMDDPKKPLSFVDKYNMRVISNALGVLRRGEASHLLTMRNKLALSIDVKKTTVKDIVDIISVNTVDAMVFYMEMAAGDIQDTTIYSANTVAQFSSAATNDEIVRLKTKVSELESTIRVLNSRLPAKDQIKI